MQDLLELGLEFNEWGDRGGADPVQAFEAWFTMVEERLSRHISRLAIDAHPKFISDALFNLNENQFGYNCFGLDQSKTID